jgi:hypothetical protein
VSKVFLHTEFVDDGSLIQPLTLALVGETGAGYYAVSADGGMNDARGRPDRVTLAEQAPPVHHALHDARHNRIIAQAIGLIQ